jgi:hypothetical protein
MKCNGVEIKIKRNGAGMKLNVIAYCQDPGHVEMLSYKNGLNYVASVAVLHTIRTLLTVTA